MMHHRLTKLNSITFRIQVRRVARAVKGPLTRDLEPLVSGQQRRAAHRNNVIVKQLPAMKPRLVDMTMPDADIDRIGIGGHYIGIEDEFRLTLRVHNQRVRAGSV
jgi:hypothetical protein